MSADGSNADTPMISMIPSTQPNIGKLGVERISNFWLFLLREGSRQHRKELIAFTICELLALGLIMNFCSSNIPLGVFLSFTTLVLFFPVFLSIVHKIIKEFTLPQTVFSDYNNAVFLLRTTHQIKPQYGDSDAWAAVARVVNRHLYDTGAWHSEIYLYNDKICSNMVQHIVYESNDNRLKSYSDLIVHDLEESLHEQWDSVQTVVV